jgi:alanine racemase
MRGVTAATGIDEGKTATKPRTIDFSISAAARSVAAGVSGVLAVDLGALARNYNKLRAMVAPAECAAVVKANAYGLGVDGVVPALIGEGCRTFFVATVAEAQAVRALAPGLTIYALNGLLPGTAEYFARIEARPVLGSLAEVEAWNAFCASRGTPLPAAIHIDTGMNRLGVKAADCELLREAPPLDAGAPHPRAFPVSLVMSHLACADEPNHPANGRQHKAFVALSAGLPAPGRSLVNSAGIFLGRDYHFDLARPGIALYGGNPFARHPNPMEPVAHVFARVANIGEAAAGETVGYGAARRLARPTRYATVAAGYADGYFRALGSDDGREGAAAWAGEHRLPILGRVSMDLSVFDITDMPAGALQPGDFLELIGSHYTVDDAAACAGTIGYEVLTSLGARYHRVYFGGESRG